MDDLAGKRFVIAGLSRLTVRVSGLIAGRGGEVTVLVPDDQAGAEHAVLRSRLPAGASVVERPRAEDAIEETIGVASQNGRPECFLALADDDLSNLAAALACHALDPVVPVVLRAYDTTLADQLEAGLGVRRAFSVSALSAPAFLAAALGASVDETLRLGEGQVAIWELPVGEGSAIVGRLPEEAGAANGIHVIARTHGDAAAWQAPPADGGPLSAGDRVLVGGPVDRVIALALAGSGLFAARKPDRARRRAERRRVRSAARARRRSGTIAGGTLLPITAVVLAVFLVVTIVIFGVALHKGPIDSLYFAISTALGNSTLDESNAWLKIIGVIAMLAGGALLGVLFSYLASVATTVRIEQRMGRRAEQMSGHAVVAGLGTVGYRITELLHQHGIPLAAIDRAPDDRHAEAAGATAPVLTGDVRLPENLRRAGIEDAACLFACTDSDLANIEACLQAKRLNPSIRTVARIFDHELAERLKGTFGVDAAVSATQVAASAFVGAATDERARRTFFVGDVDYVAQRIDVMSRVDAERLRELRAVGALVLAKRGEDGTAAALGPDEALEAGSVAVVTGPMKAFDLEGLEG